MSALVAIYPLEISMENDALIETYKSYNIVYEPWAEGFGCRLIVRPLARAESIVPEWPLLDREGVYQREVALRRVPYLDQVEKLGDAAEGASHMLLVSSTDGDPDFGIADTFFDEIPSNYRRLVAPLGGFQWLALNAIAAEPSFADYLAAELVEFGPLLCCHLLDAVTGSASKPGPAHRARPVDDRLPQARARLSVVGLALGGDGDRDPGTLPAGRARHQFPAVAHLVPEGPGAPDPARPHPGHQRVDRRMGSTGADLDVRAERADGALGGRR